MVTISIVYDTICAMYRFVIYIVSIILSQYFYCHHDNLDPR
jgi:hypothetical protein